MYPLNTPQVIRLWPGKAPGSEGWTQQETVAHLRGQTIVRNVVDPTITAYFPPAGKANGTAVIICPGGGFHLLAIDNEGIEVAHDLNSMGVAAFVLEYRLTRTNVFFPLVMAHRLRRPRLMRLLLEKLTPLILADGQQAVHIVRSHAVEWGLAPDRIGMIGFSAGGYLALNVALHHDADTKPNFVAALYPAAPDPLTPPPERIPLFLLCAEDDSHVSPDNSVRINHTWKAADFPVEFHLMPSGGHAFGMTKQNLPTDAWPELLHEWLRTQGYLTTPTQGKEKGYTDAGHRVS
jgi:acetyl esterase/lipase